MSPIERFYQLIENELTATLATGTAQNISMRLISPVLYQNRVLFFTHANSRKYKQFKENVHGCIGIGSFFAEGDVIFCGPTLAEENILVRQAYCQKFPDAFEPNVGFNGRACEFLLFTPKHLTGWVYPENPAEKAPFPTIPVELDIPEYYD